MHSYMRRKKKNTQNITNGTALGGGGEKITFSDHFCFFGPEKTDRRLLWGPFPFPMLEYVIEMNVNVKEL